jgi:hypothetical protein
MPDDGCIGPEPFARKAGGDEAGERRCRFGKLRWRALRFGLVVKVLVRHDHQQPLERRPSSAGVMALEPVAAVSRRVGEHVELRLVERAAAIHRAHHPQCLVRLQQFQRPGVVAASRKRLAGRSGEMPVGANPTRAS